MKKITIVTVTFNCKEDLRKTFDSLHSQTFQNYDHVIVDGGSTDGTVDLIIQNQSKVTKWISEKDRGIYDAMNKAIDLVDGEYVQFLNAGDVYFDNESLSEVSVFMNGINDVIYGEIIVTDKSYNEVFHVKPLGFDLETLRIRGTASVNHQSFFIKTKLAPKYSFKFKLKGELDWYIQILKKNPVLKTMYIEKPLIKYKLGGAGNIRYMQNLKEWIVITGEQFGLIQIIKNFSSYKKFLNYNKRIRKYVFKE